MYCYIIIRMVTYSSFCVAKFMLSACRPNFAETVCTTYKVEQAFVRPHSHKPTNPQRTNLTEVMRLQKRTCCKLAACPLHAEPSRPQPNRTRASDTTGCVLCLLLTADDRLLHNADVCSYAEGPVCYSECKYVELPSYNQCRAFKACFMRRK